MSYITRNLKDLISLILFKRYRGSFRGIYSSPPKFKNEWKNNNFSFAKTPNKNSIDLILVGQKSNFNGVFSWDYPTLYWLSKISIKQKLKVLDWGGGIGSLYERLRHYIDISSWIILDLPETKKFVDKGTIDDKKIDFVFDLEKNKNYNVLIAYSALQYKLDFNVQNFLNSLTVNCKHVILNRVPVTGSKSFFSLQSLGGKTQTPALICNIHDFFNVKGFELIDFWHDDLDKSDRIRFSNKYVGYMGFYFKRI